MTEKDEKYYRLMNIPNSIEGMLIMLILTTEEFSVKLELTRQVNQGPNPIQTLFVKKGQVEDCLDIIDNISIPGAELGDISLGTTSQELFTRWALKLREDHGVTIYLETRPNSSEIWVVGPVNERPNANCVDLLDISVRNFIPVSGTKRSK